VGKDRNVEPDLATVELPRPAAEERPPPPVSGVGPSLEEPDPDREVKTAR
jgi:hypothetical protein